MLARSVDAGNGWQWIADGFALFRRDAVVWVTITVALLVIWFAAAMIPLLGQIAINLFMPVFVAGIMLGCRALDEGKSLEFSHLFAGFRGKIGPLITVGAVHLAGIVALLVVLFAVAGSTMLSAVFSGGSDFGMLFAALRSVLVALAIGLLLYVPVVMLIWFAPLLIVFHDTPPVEAMKLSFRACWINVWSGLAYGAIVLVLWLVASIPFLLGLLFFNHTATTEIYTSYKDIFVPGDAPPAAAPRNPLLS